MNGKKIFEKHILYWIFQVIGWTLYGLLIFLSVINKGEQFTFSNWVNLLETILFGIFLSHRIRHHLIKKSYYHLEAKRFIPPVIFGAALVAIINVLLIKISASIINWEWANWVKLSLFVSFISMFLVYLLWCTIYFTFLLIEETRRKELRNLELQKSQAEIELQQLRNQLNPHFLFNALNAIRALVEVEPQQAKQAITRLSSLLRSNLKQDGNSLVSLGQEKETVTSYLELEKIRFEERLEIQWDWNDVFNNVKIPAFSIQTLVENAIKHGISKRIHGGFVRITVNQFDNSLFVEVQNSGEWQEKVDLGVGLKNLSRRLQIQYGDSVKLEHLSGKDLVKVSFTIPIQTI